MDMGTHGHGLPAQSSKPNLISCKNLREIDVIDSNDDIMSRIRVMVLLGTAVKN